MAFLQSSDPRWQGAQHWYLTINFVKNAVLFAFCILMIVETTLFRTWYNTYHDTVEFDSTETVVDFFFRIGIVLIADILSMMITYTLLAKQRFHPVYALTQSLIVFCLYPVCFTFNIIIVYYKDSYMDKIGAWRRMCYGEMALQVVLLLCWAAMTVYACVAVHRWRFSKVEARVRNTMREELELKNAENGRKDSADVDV